MIQQGAKVVLRPYLAEILVVFAAGWCVGRYTAKEIPTLAEVKQEVATNPESAPEIVQKREPMFQYGDGRLTLNLGRLRR